MYHSISRQTGKLHVSPELFEEQCCALSKAGWRGISLTEAEDHFLRGKKLPPRTCLFSFDDGYLDNYVYAEPILRAYGHQGVIFPALHMLEEGKKPRPNRDELASAPERRKELGDLHTPRMIWRAGYRVREARFCSWSEIHRLREGGVMDAAPHSLTHGRVVSGLDFTKLHNSGKGHGFFGVFPYEALWGMPVFPTGYALSTRGYTLNPALFDLVRAMVPQKRKEAQNYLSDAGNRQNVLAAIKKLPWLGRPETDVEFRARLFTEFSQCRKIFAERLGHTPVSFCWPWGASCKESVEEAERAGFRLFFCTSWTGGAYRQGKPVRRSGVRYFTTPERILHKARFFSVAPLGAAYAYLVRVWRFSRAVLQKRAARVAG